MRIVAVGALGFLISLEASTSQDEADFNGPRDNKNSFVLLQFVLLQFVDRQKNMFSTHAYARETCAACISRDPDHVVTPEMFGSGRCAIMRAL